MMRCRIHIVVPLVAFLSLPAGIAGAQQLKPMQVREIEPTSLARGKTTIVTVTGIGVPDIQSAFIYPPIGVTFVEVNRSAPNADGTVSVGIVLAVDPKAAPGERTLSVSSPGWDFELTKIRIQDHDIRIADLKAGLPGPGDHPAEHAPTRLFSFTLVDDQQDVFGPDASVLGALRAAISCGGKRISASHTDFSSLGVSGAPASSGGGAAEPVPTQMVRRDKEPDKPGGPPMPPPPTMPTTIPTDKATAVAAAGTRGQTVTFALPEWAGKGSCEIRVSVKDKAGNESNALRIKAELE